MTVLERYQRLEALGLWRADESSQRREVVVSIGEATLLLTEMSGRVVTQWSLPALVRMNPGERPAVFALDGFDGETLEIADGDMIDALEAVMNAVAGGRRSPARIRLWSGTAVTCAIILAAAVWLPDAISAYVARVAPEGVRTGIAQDVYREVQGLTGRACDAPAGRRALARLQSRLFPAGDVRLAVLPSVLKDARQLPGNRIVIGRGLVEDHETPEVVAAYLVAESLRQSGRDGLRDYLGDLGLVASFRLLTTGEIDPARTSAWAAARLVESRPGVGDTILAQALADQGIAVQPYATAVDITGESTSGLARAAQSIAPVPILDDGDWLALQRICEDRG